MFKTFYQKTKILSVTLLCLCLSYSPQNARGMKIIVISGVSILNEWVTLHYFIWEKQGVQQQPRLLLLVRQIIQALQLSFIIPLRCLCKSPIASHFNLLSATYNGNIQAQCCVEERQLRCVLDHQQKCSETSFQFLLCH